MRKVLAVDGGNSKTLCAVVDEGGSFLALARSGGSNYQGIGRKAAAESLSSAIGAALSEAGVERVDVGCYGLAGADRDKDFEVFRELLGPIDPADESILVNDTLLALRAGTADGVGVALIGGAGSNCIGIDRSGRIRKAGGLGPLTGDRANAYSIVEAAMVEAFKGVDGRGPRTLLEDKFKDALGLDALEDVIEFGFADSGRNPGDLGALAPLVFEAANAGDAVAVSVLRAQGAAAGEAALAVMRDLFDPADAVTLALGGGVYQKGANRTLVKAIDELVRNEFPLVSLKVLEEPPLLGGILKCYDMISFKPEKNIIDGLKHELAIRDREL